MKICWSHPELGNQKVVSKFSKTCGKKGSFQLSKKYGSLMKETKRRTSARSGQDAYV